MHSWEDIDQWIDSNTSMATFADEEVPFLPGALDSAFTACGESPEAMRGYVLALVLEATCDRDEVVLMARDDYHESRLRRYVQFNYQLVIELRDRHNMMHQSVVTLSRR